MISPNRLVIRVKQHLGQFGAIVSYTYLDNPSMEGVSDHQLSFWPILNIVGKRKRVHKNRLETAGSDIDLVQSATPGGISDIEVFTTGIG